MKLQWMVFISFIISTVCCTKPIDFESTNHKAIYIKGHVNDKLTYVVILNLTSLLDEGGNNKSTLVKDAEVYITTPTGEQIAGEFDYNQFEFPDMEIMSGVYQLEVKVDGKSIVAKAEMPNLPQKVITKVFYSGDSKVDLRYDIDDSDLNGFDYYLARYRDDVYPGDYRFIPSSYFKESTLTDPWFLNSCNNPPYPPIFYEVDSMIFIKINKKDRLIVETDIQNAMQLNNPFYVPARMSGNLENKDENIYGHFYATRQFNSEPINFIDRSDTLLEVRILDKNSNPVFVENLEQLRIHCLVDGETRERILRVDPGLEGKSVPLTYNHLVSRFLGCESSGGKSLPTFKVYASVRDQFGQNFTTNTIHIIQPNSFNSIELIHQ